MNKRAFSVFLALCEQARDYLAKAEELEARQHKNDDAGIDVQVVPKFIGTGNENGVARVLRIIINLNLGVDWMGLRELAGFPPAKIGTPKTQLMRDEMMAIDHISVGGIQTC